MKRLRTPVVNGCGRKSDVRPGPLARGDSGLALVAAAIATLVLAGAVGVYHFLTEGAGVLAGAQQRYGTLDAFALGVLNLCPPLVDSVNEKGDFATQSFVEQLNTDGSFDVVLSSAEYQALDAELASMDQWSDYSGGSFSPDVIVRSGEFTGILDLDFVVASAAKEDGAGNWGEGTVRWEEEQYSGALGGGGAGAAAVALGEQLDTYRCYAWARDGGTGNVMYMGILER